MTDSEKLKNEGFVNVSKKYIINPNNPPIPMPSPSRMEEINYEMAIRHNKKTLDMYNDAIRQVLQKNTPEPKFFRALQNLCIVCLKVMVKSIRNNFSLKR